MARAWSTSEAVNLDQTQYGRDFSEPVPAGDYDVMCVDAGIINSASAPVFLRFSIVEGPETGRQVTCFFALNSDKAAYAKAMEGYLMQAYTAMGIPLPATIPEYNEDMVDFKERFARVKVTVEADTRAGHEGQKQNKVVAINAPKNANRPAAPAARAAAPAAAAPARPAAPAARPAAATAIDVRGLTWAAVHAMDVATIDRIIVQEKLDDSNWTDATLADDLCKALGITAPAAADTTTPRRTRAAAPAAAPAEPAAQPARRGARTSIADLEDDIPFDQPG